MHAIKSAAACPYIIYSLFCHNSQLVLLVMRTCTLRQRIEFDSWRGHLGADMSRSTRNEWKPRWRADTGALICLVFLFVFSLNDLKHHWSICAVEVNSHPSRFFSPNPRRIGKALPSGLLGRARGFAFPLPAAPATGGREGISVPSFGS